MKFKEGDRVQLIDNAAHSPYPIGATGTVLYVDNSKLRYKVYIKEDISLKTTSYLYPSDLTLINEPKNIVQW